MGVKCAVLLTKNVSSFPEVTLLVLTPTLFLQFASQLLNTHHGFFFIGKKHFHKDTVLPVNCLSCDDHLPKYVLNIKLYLLLTVLLLVCLGLKCNHAFLCMNTDFSRWFAGYSLCSFTRHWC